MYKQREYWLKKIENKTRIVDNTGDMIQKKISINIPETQLGHFNKISQNNYYSKFTILISIFGALLKRYNENFDGFIKSYSNGLAILFDIDTSDLSSITLKEFIIQNKTEVNNGFSNTPYPNDLILDDYSDINFVVNDLLKKKIKHSSIYFQCVIKNEIEVEIEFNHKKFDSMIMESFLSNFIHIVANIEKYINRDLSEIISLKEEDLLKLQKYNETQRDFPNNKTMVDLFEEQVELTPGNIALSCESNDYTYEELNKRANQLGYFIRETCNVKKREVVIVLMPKSVELIISFISILKTGCIYLPIDDTYPDERIEYIINNSNAALVISNKPKDFSIHCININAINLGKYPVDNHNLGIKPNDIAYLIYTSGSTGSPKGVLIKHTSNINMSLDQIRLLRVNGDDKILWFASPSFDASISEIMMALYTGARLFIISKNETTDTKLFVSAIKRKEITIITLPPSYLDLLEINSTNTNLRCIITAGESANPIKVRDITSNGIEYFNAYGPTEYSVCATMHKAQNNYLYKNVPIGRPIANTKVYILGDNLHLLPIGVIGRIYLTGIGLAECYYNDPAKTKEKFVTNPYNEAEILYDTGDLGRWNAFGEIEFCGRTDSQVKIRGHRIELGEIEISIQKFSNEIKQVVVCTDKNKSNLFAYFVSNKKINKEYLRNYLLKILPHYMIPNYYLQIQQIPLTINGKIDFAKLPKLSDSDIIKSTYESPRNSLDKVIIDIWEKMLNVKKIGILDDFFELGGNSLLVTQFINELYKESNYTISYKDFFRNSNIKSLSDHLNPKSYHSISLVEIQSDYAVTYSQKRIWLLSQNESTSIAYNMPLVYEIIGDISKDILEKAICQIISRHESLRTSFFMNENGEIRQRILRPENLYFHLMFYDFSTIIDKNKVTNQVINNVINNRFNLENAPLINCHLIHLNEDRYIFLMNMHHIISDGWSMNILFDELLSVYNSLKDNKIIDLEPIKLQYKDYTLWILNKVKNGALKKAEEYWLNRFNGQIPVIDLPTHNIRPIVQTHNGNFIKRIYSHDLINRLSVIYSSNGATLFMALMSIIKILLFKYSGQNDLIIGTPVAGRNHSDLNNQIGFYLNTLAIRSTINDNMTFLDFLLKEKNVLLEAYEYQDYPFDLLVEKLNYQRDISRSALFDIFIVLQNQEQLGILDYEKLKFNISPYEYQSTISQFDISFLFSINNGLELKLEYNTDLFDRSFIESIFSHFETITNSIIRKPDTLIKDLIYISREEIKELISDYQGKKLLINEYDTVIDIFENRVKESSNSIAIKEDNCQMSYLELNSICNQFANYLKYRYDIKPSDFIAVSLERSQKTVIAILGILKTGAAYVPIDTNYPVDRIEYILSDTSCKLLVDDLLFESFVNEKNRYSEKNLKNKISNNDAVYIMYTSGSTGSPKGIIMKHGSMTNLISSQCNKIYSNKIHKVLHSTSIGFDVSFQEIIYSLSIGACLFPINDNIKKDPMMLIDFIYENNIDCSFLPTSYFKVLIENENFIKLLGNGLNNIFVAGEQLIINDEVINRIENTQFVLHNHYGPAETHVVTTCILDKKNHPLKYIPPIGTPIENTQIYILDKNRNIVPKWVRGDIYIAGACLSKGYLNKLEQTKERFISNPFTEGKLMYYTGDIGRWMPNGQIEYLGRDDKQIKIRGYRVELGEVEKVILNYSKKIKQVVVETEDLNNSKRLIAFIASENDINKTDLMAYLSKVIPHYMIPQNIYIYNSILLNTNGKIDRKSLSLSNSFNENQILEYPETNEEKLIASIWSKLLDIEQIDINTSFFDIGGHSLKIVQLQYLINKSFKLELKLHDLYQNRTIKRQAELIINQTSNNFVSKSNIEVSISENGLYELSPSQKRFWIMEKLSITNNGELNYIVFNYKCEIGIDDIDILEKSVKAVFKKHEILRTYFTEESGEPYQKVISYDEIDFSRIITTNYTSTNIDIPENIKQFKTSLSNYPLLKIQIDKTNNGIYIFGSIHHAICDGWSINILKNDIKSAYYNIKKGEREPLSPLFIQYKDYSVWLNKEMKKVNSDAYFWKEYLKGDLPLIELPYDYGVDEIEKQGTNYVTFYIENEVKELINKILISKDVTLVAFFSTCLNILLRYLANSADIILGLPFANRENPQISEMIGFFLNTVLLKVHISDKEDFYTLLKRVHENLIDIMEHQGFPIENILEEINYNQNKKGHPISGIFLNMLSFDSNNNLEADERKEKLERTNQQFNLDLEFYFKEYKNCIEVTCAYSNRFKSKSIEYWLGEFVKIIDCAVSDNDLQIEDYNLFTTCYDEIIYPKPSNNFVKFTDDYKSTNETIVSRFNKQVSFFGTNIAIIDGDNKYTYDELDLFTNTIANKLIKESAQSKNVGLLIEHSYFSIAAIIATLKSGKAYIPLDIELPISRLAYILNETDCQILIVSEKTYDLASKIVIENSLNLKLLDISLLKSQLSNVIEYDIPITPNDIAYILYTSGSTGNPKGVYQSHLNVLHFIQVYTNNLHINNLDKLSLLPKYTFDASIMDIFGALLNGSTLLIYDLKEYGLENLVKWINKECVTILHTVPTLYRYIVNNIMEDKEVSSIRLVVLGGEAVYKEDFDKFKNKFKSGTIFINGYGPTESTVTTQNFMNHESEIHKTNIPIGHAVDNTTVKILKENGEIARIYEEGEITYFSEYLALGYYKNQEQTNKAFKKDPNGNRYYCSGDIGKLLPNGQIEYTRRKDTQVKINGIRIELGEVEQMIQKIDSIERAIVVIANNSTKANKALLLAFMKTNKEVKNNSIRSYLIKYLPLYMIPTHFIRVDNFPLTPTGKIDRNKLVELYNDKCKNIENDTVIRTESDNEKKIKSLWAKILNIEPEEININSNFFEIGGNSLKIIELVKKLNELYPAYIISPVTLFQYPTITDFVNYFLENSNHGISDNSEDATNIIENTLNIINNFE